MQAKAREELRPPVRVELAYPASRRWRRSPATPPAPPRAGSCAARRATEAVREGSQRLRAFRAPQALEGFLRKTGLTREQLAEERARRRVVRRHRTPGRATAEVLAAAILAVIRAFPCGPSMRAGARSRLDREPALGAPAARHRRLVRGREIVPASPSRAERAATLAIASTTRVITIGSAVDYVAESSWQAWRHRRL